MYLLWSEMVRAADRARPFRDTESRWPYYEWIDAISIDVGGARGELAYRCFRARWCRGSL